jgi:hypothetical protein
MTEFSSAQSCDQERLVRKKREVRYLQEIRKRHLAGAKPVRPKPARQVGSEPCGRHGGERVEAGRQRAWRCVGARACRSWEVSPEITSIPGVESLIDLEDSSGAPHPMANGGNAPGGVPVHDTPEEDDPGTWEARALGGGHRRPKTRETKVWAGMRRGSRRGPIGAMTQGNV